MPEGAVYVGRGSKWGNPWRVGEPYIQNATDAARRFSAAVEGFTSNECFCPPDAHPDSYIGRIIRDLPELRGKDLACWCRLDQPCHADVLLKLANAEARQETD